MNTKENAISWLQGCLQNRDVESIEGRIFAKVILGLNMDVGITPSQQVYIGNLCEAHAAEIGMHFHPPGSCDRKILIAAAQVATYANGLC